MTAVRRARTALRALPFALLLLAIGGCFNPFSPRIAPTLGVYIPPPEPNSPQGVVRLFEWCWNNRDITLYKEIFTADYVFVFALGDSAGNLFRDDPVTRETELDMARNLFVGGGNEPPANSIVLHLDPTLRPTNDSRPGKDPRWHKEIVTGVDLSIKTDQQDFRITGYARFFVVRGDSALIPEDLGFAPDSMRWYIEQWNDETLAGPGAFALEPAGPGISGLRTPTARGTAGAATHTWPTQEGRRADAAALSSLPLDMTWGQLKAVYSR
jgi:hypothetical protein